MTDTDAAISINTRIAELRAQIRKLQRARKICRAPDCHNPRFCKGLCEAHYRRRWCKQRRQARVVNRG